VATEGIRIDPFDEKAPVQSAQPEQDEYERAHGLIHDVHERLFELQLKQAERMAELSFKIAHNSVQVLTVVAEASATILGKTASTKEVADQIVEAIRKIKAEFTPGGMP
jgi:hypothetical protein